MGLSEGGNDKNVERSDILIGRSYAYLEAGKPYHQPLRAVVDGEPEGGYVQVVLHHPDTGQESVRIKTRALVGAWDDVPEARFAQHQASIQAAEDRNEKFTWADLAQQRYDHVRRQRALAERLSSLGISRAGRHYAGAGGSTSRPHDADLQLNYDEIERLLDFVERGHGAVPTTPMIDENPGRTDPPGVS